MRRNLLNERQPFGEYHDERCMPAGLNGVAMMDKHPGKDMHVGNNGKDQILPINRNPYPGAYAEGEAHRDNPFAWCGHPEKR